MPTIKNRVSIVQFCEDPNLLNLQLWPRQREILTDFWEGDYRLGIWSLGRRSGKTLMAAISAVYAGCVMAHEYRKQLRKGEPFYIICVANALDQARLALHNIRDLIEGSPILKPLILRSTADTLELSNGAIFRALPSSSRTGRGLACTMLIMDEAAHYLDTEGNSAGDQLYQALAPSVAQFNDLGRILLLSSPWIQQGIFWDLHKQASSGQYQYMQHVNLATWLVNPVISQDFLEQERLRDPAMFQTEYGANFNQSLAAFLDPALVDAAVNYDREQLFALPDFRYQYYCALDPPKGSRDSFVACITHLDNGRLIVDKWHQFMPSWSDGKKTQIAIAEVENWLIEHHRIFGFAKVVLDQYNSQSTIQRLRGQMVIEELTWTIVSKTQAFTKLREFFNSGKIELYPHVKAIQQLKNLIVQYRSNGTWSVSGGAGVAVDDYPLSLAAAVLATPEDSGEHWLSIYRMSD